MAGIAPLFETNSVQQTQTISLMLPDPNSFDPAHVIARPLIARYANTNILLTRNNLLLTRVETSAATTLSCPVIGTLRKIALDNTVPGNATLIAEGISTLLEISPLPFFIESILRAIPGGVPVFYIGSPSIDPLLNEDETILQDRILGTGNMFYFGAVFQDRLCLEPWSWAGIIERAIIAAGEDASAWTNFINALFPLNTSRIIKVLDHVGRIHPPTQFSMTVNGQQQMVSSDADGTLDVSSTTGDAIELKWLGNPNPGELVSHPVMAMYETGESSNPDTTLILPSIFQRGHLQLLELANWFANPVEGSKMERFRSDSRVEPLIDGYKTFRLIADDMIHCAPDVPYSGDDEGRPGAHFAGWGFKEFVLDSKLLDENQKPYTYSALVQHLVDRNCDVHALVNKLFSVPGDMDDAAQANAILLTVMITDIVLVASVLGAVDTNAPGMTILMGAQLLSPLGVLLMDDLNTFIEDKMDQSAEMFPKFNEINPNLAIRSVYPSLHEDNPLAETITVPLPQPMVLTDFVVGAGTWHQKVQLFKRAEGKFDDRGNQFSVYVGGMDMNGNRLDNFGRQGPSAYHDVHSRITGPGAVDVFQAWEERYAYELRPAEREDWPDKVFSVPTIDDVTLIENPKHIVQISRTLFKPANPASDHSFSFAPEGDNTINQNILRGIREAREYIYIEDQYFIPNESTLGEAYLDALLEAADHCQRLIVVGLSVMALADVPFGHERRADISSRLLARWGNRALIGAPLRRPILQSPGRITHEGRCIVYEDINSSTDTIKIGPRARLPKSLPFWLWVNGELMMVVELADNGEIIDTHPVVTLKVLRGDIGSNGGWGATKRDHVKGCPATASQLRGIFVHAKTMMVDDIFVSIGSANINRRGLFSDGEMNVFAIPEQLKASTENPAKILRTELWAEQLGLPPSMGASLLQDPIAAFELFRRNFYGGNRFVPFSLFDFNDDPELKFSISSNLLANALMNFGMGWFVTHREQLFNTLSDPTTIDDPQPTPGP
jgi:phosphatidylserine/phosphatidylglycerophosphate/cardiolipin synthase-like enzyme